MMDDVMYGVIFSARMDMFRKDPPVNASNRLNASPEVCAASQREKYVLSTPGTGSCEPKRMTASISSVKKVLCRISLI